MSTATIDGNRHQDAASETVKPSWEPLDLAEVLNGTIKLQPPTLMPREDGVCLLYPRMVHSFQGESESGKSMLLHAEAARTLAAGQQVLFIDFESDQVTVVNRLLMLGASAENILKGLHYIRPETHPMSMTADRSAWERLLSTRYTLAVIDGVTEAFSVFGVKSIDNDEVSTWGRNVPRTIANRTGAAVVVIDHVTKDAATRGRFAIGAQAKMSYLTGASYTVEVIKPLGVGLRGQLSIRVGKDRPGLVRPNSGPYRSSDRTQQAAVATIDSTDGQTISYTLEAPRAGVDSTVSTPSTFRYTYFMEQISVLLEQVGIPTSKRGIRAAIKGDNGKLDDALATLNAEGYVQTTSTGSVSVRPYRQTADPGSDKYDPSVPLAA